MSVGGTEGYADEAESLVKRYDDLAFADVHRPVLHLIPSTSCELEPGATRGTSPGLDTASSP
jgi:hypothetical protein